MQKGSHLHQEFLHSGLSTVREYSQKTKLRLTFGQVCATHIYLGGHVASGQEPE